MERVLFLTSMTCPLNRLKYGGRVMTHTDDLVRPFRLDSASSCSPSASSSSLLSKALLLIALRAAFPFSGRADAAATAGLSSSARVLRVLDAVRDLLDDAVLPSPDFPAPFSRLLQGLWRVAQSAHVDVSFTAIQTSSFFSQRLQRTSCATFSFFFLFCFCSPSSSSFTRSDSSGVIFCLPFTLPLALEDL